MSEKGDLRVGRPTSMPQAPKNREDGFRPCSVDLFSLSRIHFLFVSTRERTSSTLSARVLRGPTHLSYKAGVKPRLQPTSPSLAAGHDYWCGNGTESKTASDRAAQDFVWITWDER